MAKNILIFSDGTGQHGGVLFEERRSNIYKLYRATRCGPDSVIDPSEQFAFYDAGIGTVPGGITDFGRAWRWIYNLVCQATGLGLTSNIVDCYSAILRVWEPGDRIFLFGFSRGAYTVRCLGGVLALCGVPTCDREGAPLKRDPGTIRRLAECAVKRVYQHFRASKRQKTDDLRRALAERFRAEHRSDAAGLSNAYPHFIGVFDTVAALANKGLLLVLGGAAVLLVGLASVVLWLVLSWPFWSTFPWFIGAAFAFVLSAYLATHVKVAFGLSGYNWWQTIRITRLRMQFYDTNLSPHVGFARHALAIDERRKAFDRVPWGDPNTRKRSQSEWFQQVWFAGCHSDIGGSYPEAESRLSDITLEWMVAAAKSVPGGIRIDDSVLHLYPAAGGMQHDEAKRGFTRWLGKITRSIPDAAQLHESVYQRAMLDAVLNYDVMEPYRPAGLAGHREFCRRCGTAAQVARN